jgi:hypothetical protein
VLLALALGALSFLHKDVASRSSFGSINCGSTPIINLSVRS